MVMSGLGLKVGQNSLIAKQTLIPSIIIETCRIIRILNRFSRIKRILSIKILEDKMNTKHYILRDKTNIKH